MSEKDRRRYLRVAADDGLECAIEGVGIVHIVGISSEGRGMRVITDKELPSDKELGLKLALNEDLLFDGKAKCVWHEAWDFEFCSRHIGGLEILGLSDEERKALVKAIPVAKEPGSLSGDMT